MKPEEDEEDENEEEEDTAEGDRVGGGEAVRWGEEGGVQGKAFRSYGGKEKFTAMPSGSLDGDGKDDDTEEEEEEVEALVHRCVSTVCFFFFR